MERTQRRYTTCRQSSKKAVPKGKLPRPQLLHLRELRNFVTNEDESENLQTTPTNEPTSLQHPPRESKTPNYSRSLKFPYGNSSPTEVKLKWRLTTKTTRTIPQYQAPSSQAGRPPPIVLASQVNLMQLQRRLKGLLKGNFELPYFTFYPNSQKPLKAVIRHLSLSAPAEDISAGLVNLGFDVISVKLTSTTRQSPTEGTTTVNIPLFLITLPRTSREVIKLTNLRHTVIRVEAYKAQPGLTQ
jgi:hypothetical protein